MMPSNIVKQREREKDPSIYYTLLAGLLSMLLSTDARLNATRRADARMTCILRFILGLLECVMFFLTMMRFSKCKMGEISKCRNIGEKDSFLQKCPLGFLDAFTPLSHTRHTHTPHHTPLFVSFLFPGQPEHFSSFFLVLVFRCVPSLTKRKRSDDDVYHGLS